MALRVTMSFRMAAMMATFERLFAGSQQPLLEGFQGRIEPGGDLGGHEENATDGGPAAEDVAAPSHPAAIEVVRDNPDQSGDRSVGQGAKFRQQGEQEWRPGPARRLAWSTADHAGRSGWGWRR